MDRGRNTMALLCVNPELSFLSRIHTSTNKLWQILKQDPSKRFLINFLVQVSLMKTVCKTPPLCYI